MSEPAFPGVRGQNGYGTATCQVNEHGEVTAYVEHNQGMTLLDYFAGQALAGLMANCDLTDRKAADMAVWAFEAGRAMMVERAANG